MDLIFDDGDGIRSRADFQSNIDCQRTVGIDYDAGSPIRPEGGAGNFKVVMADLQALQRIETLFVAGYRLVDAGFGVDGRDSGLRNHRATGIRYRTRDAAADASLRSADKKHE